jgi:glutathione synthase/RimK-type ligase-like ATP-grasp enzyme
VIVGDADDEHVEAVSQRLYALGARVVILDSNAFPARTRLSLGERLADVRLGDVPLERPRAVYVRQLHLSPLSFGVDAADAMRRNWRRTLTAFHEKTAFLRGLLGRWEALRVPLYNPPSPEWCCHKPIQLAMLNAAGLPVPRTLWSNHPATVRAFARGRRLAYKPIAGGAATLEVRAADLASRRLAPLDAAPVTFQELLPGENRRVFVLEGRVVAAYRVTSRALDYRQHEERVELIDAEPAVAAASLRATSVLGLRFGGVDLKADTRGRFRLLEVNRSPMFLGFEARGGGDVLSPLARALAR